MEAIDLRQALGRLAANHRWTWRPATARLLARATNEPDRHPAAAVAGLPDERVAELASEATLVAQVTTELEDLDRYLDGGPSGPPEIAYLSPEFGLSELVPQYSGGLGVLAGDHLKAASDAGLPLVGVGLLYRHGFFRQGLRDGHQVEHYERYEAADFGAVDTGVEVKIMLADSVAAARIWRVDVGRVQLLLLDTDVGPNTDIQRSITDRLYGGDRAHRLEQEAVLGVGGVLALEALGGPPQLLHLNEGHAGFAILALVDRALRAGAATLADAMAQVRPGIVFTTHTPVPAGIDRFERPLAERYLAPWAHRWQVPVERLLDLGRDPTHGRERFNMAVLCLGGAGRANGVSSLHGRVSRELFAAVDPAPEITHVTNGVHARTWTDPGLQDLFDSELGTRWADGDPEAWERVRDIRGDAIRGARRAARAPLQRRLAQHGIELDPRAMVIAFARRFAPYKRANLMLRERERLTRLLTDETQPVHFVFAGKAHPADQPGQAIMAEVVAFAGSAASNGRFSFLADYDMGIARDLVRAADVWLNNPVRPREASGTSGQKASLNGALNCSIRDGWWDEMSDGLNGWDIPGSDLEDPRARDEAEATSLLDQLEAIVAEYHLDGDAGRPSETWLVRMRHAWLSLGPRVTAARMIGDYEQIIYRPALAMTR